MQLRLELVIIEVFSCTYDVICMANEQKSRTAHEKHATVDLYEGLITEISKQVGRGGYRRSIFTM
jgi:hypothetical protein